MGGAVPDARLPGKARETNFPWHHGNFLRSRLCVRNTEKRWNDEAEAAMGGSMRSGLGLGLYLTQKSVLWTEHAGLSTI